jgi:hypothetical protein
VTRHPSHAGVAASDAVVFDRQQTLPTIGATMPAKPLFTGNPMHDLTLPPDVTDHNLSQVIARDRYYELRDKLVRLKAASEPSMPAIDALIQDLEKAQLDYKASHGQIGNNPIEP